MENYSILTTVYVKENPKFLKESIESMLSQTALTDDYVIVKDGPLTEELDAILDEYKSKYPFINLVALPNNVGLGCALNEGLKVCKNDLVARLDSDDISMPDRCELQLKAFEQHPEYAIVGSDMDEFDDDPNVITAHKVMPHTPDELYRYGKRRNAFNHSSVMYRKSVLEQYGFYSNRRRSQDVELFSKVLYGKHQCINIDKALIKFRCGSTRVTRKKSWSNVKSDIGIFRDIYKMGYSGFFDFMYVVTIQIGFYLLPHKAAAFLYKKLFRSKK
jgi:glycosyltransferase involved in cell wall biosynthesis